MISLDELTDKDKGREVRYQTFGRIEYGKITSWNDRFIFVSYHTVIEDSYSHTGRPSIPKATSPKDLEFA